MCSIVDLFKKKDLVNEIIEKTKGCEYSLFCGGTTPNINTLLASSLFLSNDDYILYVTPNSYLANIAYDMFCEVIDYENVNLYVVDDVASTEAVVISNELRQERLNTIKSIIENNKKIIVTHIEALLKPVVSFDRVLSHTLHLKVGDEINANELIRKLVENGYERTHITYQIGEFSVRGEVIDIFPSCHDKPIRINLAFDEIESIKVFNLETQLTTNEKINEVTIYSINEIVLNEPLDELEDRLLKIDNNKLISNDFVDIQEVKANGKLNKYIKYIDEHYCTLVDYFKDNVEVIFDDITNIKNSYDATLKETFEYYQNNYEGLKIDLTYLNSFDDLINTTKKKIYLAETKKGLPQLKLLGLYDFKGYKTYDYENNMPSIVNDMKINKKKIYLTFKSYKSLELIKELFSANDIKFDIINDFNNLGKEMISLIVCENAISYGLFGEYEVISETQIFAKTKKSKNHYRSVNENTIIISSKDDLIPGDIVVHYDYGIARYKGIKTVELNNIVEDYLQLQYDNMDLLVPMDKITDLEKYIGSEGVVPKLTKIGTNEWTKKKNVVKEQLESIAKDLIELQLKREQLAGHKYQKDSEFQKMFENDFEFDETNDQLKIVEEIKQEMEKGLLIDRLICGDVGFGKTEIAMRIAFKTVYEGKQVAFMAPTTILSRQHYHTFVDRFARYGIKIALLNRLIDPSEQKKIIKQLKDGAIDIIIGTHRLLNDEIAYKDLGLLIIDEEQRFGVAHKEKIKQMKNNINVLTLTATPIPRTLQMAVTGIRSLSLLETPPKDRYPIQTYVMEHNDMIIKDAIYRELARNGQVFYLHNRISDLDVLARKIHRLVPEAKVAIGHGKMTREELEDVISSYIDGKFNVLLCTTIIETGIDIPNSNTLIVDCADRLGLAQMYQIRGRVGRTDRIAYAYFTYETDKVLSGASEKRLAAIKEFTKIGSGYKIAVRDLAIRGAGDILGREQSGFINSLGIDMYMKLLNEVINKEKGIEEKQKVNYKIDVSKHVDREYVSDDTIIIYIHKEINKISSTQDKFNTINELTDRFGKLSQSVLDYIEERYLESLLREYGIEKVYEAPNLVTITMPRNISNNYRGEDVLMTGYRISDRFSFEYRANQYIIKLTKDNLDRSWLYLATEYFEKLKDKERK